MRVLRRAAAACLPAALLFAASAHAGVLASATLDRGFEAAVATGAALPAFTGAAVGDLWVYAYRSGDWVQIPFQLDQKDASGSYFAADADPAFDANDELVWATKDMGDQVTADLWPADAASEAFARYEVQVANPLDPTKRAWAYVFRSNTLTRTFTADYVAYTDGATDSLVTEGYTLGYDGNGQLVTTRINPSGGGTGVDILDRQKVRVTVKVLFLTFNYTENDFPVTTDAFIDGAVRVLTKRTVNGPTGPSTSYSAYYPHEAIGLTATDVVSGMTFLRGSADLNNAAVGMKMYDDFNAAGVTIDGNPDGGLNTGAPSYVVASGAPGTLIAIGDVTGVGGTASLYYKDNGTFDSGDTGDGRSFGDTGIQISNPNVGSYPNLVGPTWYLPANLGNVGAQYKSYTQNPLTLAGTAQTFIPPVAVGGPPSRGAAGVALAVGPAPVRELASVRLTLPQAARVRLDALDVSGRVVATLFDGTLPAGASALAWTPRNAHGARLPAGLYTLRASGGAEATTRVLVAR